eukprot:4263715-Amphidinium_carterae.1
MDICMFQFDMVAELAFTMRETEKRDIEENNEIGEESKKEEHKENENKNASMKTRTMMITTRKRKRCRH